jgi:hydrogenase maturation protease
VQDLENTKSQSAQRHKGIVVVGVGNDFRHDDAAGLIAARRLRDSGIPAEEHQGDFATVIERWKEADSLILIDAIAPGRVPGAIYRLNASASPLNRQLFNTSTHSFGLADAIELSRTLGTLPPNVSVFGIEARNLAVGVGLSPEVEVNLPELVKEVLACAESMDFGNRDRQCSRELKRMFPT